MPAAFLVWLALAASNGLSWKNLSHLSPPWQQPGSARNPNLIEWEMLPVKMKYSGMGECAGTLKEFSSSTASHTRGALVPGFPSFA